MGSRRQPQSSDSEPAASGDVPPDPAGGVPEEADGSRFAAYASDPVGFVTTVLRQKPWEKQAEILRAVVDSPQTTVRSCHGVGKTWMAACAALWWVYSHRPSLVLTTAPTARQVEGVLWAEIHRLWHKAGQRQGQPQGLPLPGRCMLTRLAASPEQTALGLSTDEPEKFAGWHCEHMLVIVDEASGVPNRLFEVIQGTLTAAHCRLLLIGNPTRTDGFFFESHRREGWQKLRISAFDTPNFEPSAGEAVSDQQSAVSSDKDGDPDPAGADRCALNADGLPRPYLVTPEWVAQRRREWGEESDAFRVRVLGEFPRASADTLIELGWVERAEGSFQRSAISDQPGHPKALADSRPLTAESCVFGLDVARFGDCETVLAVRRGETLVALERWSGADLMQTCGQVVAAARREQPARIVVDAVGLGAGVVDRLRELQREGELEGVEIVPFSSGERASDPSRWQSRRDEAYWALRERYRDGAIAHAGSWSGLAGQLTALRYRFSSRGQVEIESKDELRRRGLPSPDQADAVALAFAPLAAPVLLPVALTASRPVVWPLPPLR